MFILFRSFSCQFPAPSPSQVQLSVSLVVAIPFALPNVLSVLLSFLNGMHAVHMTRAVEPIPKLGSHLRVQVLSASPLPRTRGGGDGSSWSVQVKVIHT